MATTEWRLKQMVSMKVMMSKTLRAIVPFIVSFAMIFPLSVFDSFLQRYQPWRVLMGSLNKMAPLCSCPYLPSVWTMEAELALSRRDSLPVEYALHPAVLCSQSAGKFRILPFLS